MCIPTYSSQDLRLLKRCALHAINNVIYALCIISSDTAVTCRGRERICSAGSERDHGAEGHSTMHKRSCSAGSERDHGAVREEVSLSESDSETRVRTGIPIVL